VANPVENLDKRVLLVGGERGHLFVLDKERIDRRFINRFNYTRSELIKE